MKKKKIIYTDTQEHRLKPLITFPIHLTYQIQLQLSNYYLFPNLKSSVTNLTRGRLFYRVSEKLFFF